MTLKYTKTTLKQSYQGRHKKNRLIKFESRIFTLESFRFFCHRYTEISELILAIFGL